MRIIGGTAAGLRLDVPKGFSVRPTPDLVKQAVFNRLAGRTEGARVLELFAGSGALGLECLSRGATRVTAIEVSGRHAALIRRNRESLGLPAERYELRTQDVFRALPQLREQGMLFDLILADPPFGEKNVGRRSESPSQRLLDDPDLPALLVSDGWFVLGHAQRDTVNLPAGWTELRPLRHGDSVMRFLQRAASTVPGGSGENFQP